LSNHAGSVLEDVGSELADSEKDGAAKYELHGEGMLRCILSR
jgi:hypothetical protein